MSHQPLTDEEVRDLVARCNDAAGARQLSLSYTALRAEYIRIHSELQSYRRISTAEMKGEQRYQHPEAVGYVRIGRRCSAGRRSLWLRENHGDGSFELRAGREGDDSYVKIERSHPLYAEIENIVADARFAADWEESDGLTLEREEAAARIKRDAR